MVEKNKLFKVKKYIIPTKPKFKVGDWVINPEWGTPRPFKLNSGHFKGISQRSDIWFNGLKRWIPKKGEWCLFRQDGFKNKRYTLTQYSHTTENRYEALDDSSYSYCEPFIGNLPKY